MAYKNKIMTLVEEQGNASDVCLLPFKILCFMVC